MDTKETKVIQNPWEDARVGVDAVTKLHVDSVATLVAHFNYRGWDFEILGVGSMITSPVFLRRWRVLPMWMDPKTIIPEEGLLRLNYLKELGLNIQGEIIAHEILKPKKENMVHVDWYEVGIRLKEGTENAGDVLRATGKVLGGAAIGMLALPALLLADPILILVVDNVRIGIYAWYERPGVS